MLDAERRERFWGDGWLVVEEAVTRDQLDRLRARVGDWVEASRRESASFGPPTVDGRPRFDLAPDHDADHPALRRVNNPSEIDDGYMSVVRDAPMVDAVSDLIGPDLKYHHCKINLKLPGTSTVVRYHQDFAFTPHTNDDVVTVLVMLDDMTEDNGCLMAVPGSHRGPVHSLFHDDRFTGYIDADVEARLREREIPILGAAGSACLMHTRLVHGSAANRSDRARGLYICVYTAADAFPIARNPMPSPHEGMIVRGRATRTARLMDAAIELPEQPIRASFFNVQEEAAGDA